MYSLILKRLFLFSLFILCIPNYSISQLSYIEATFLNDLNFLREYESNIAYKLPFRGENYKFYGTLNYHILGKAYTECRVHNTIVEAYYFSEQNCAGVNFKILKGSNHKFGKLIPGKPKRNGFYLYFLTPMKKLETPLKYYYRTGLFRVFLSYDKDGTRKINKKVSIDFEALAKHLINIDNSAGHYGLKIKKIIINRYLLDDLFQTTSGAELKRKNIYFAKFLSNKINRKFDDVYFVEFDKLK